MLKISTSPHINSSANTRGIMLDVIIALLPAFVASVLFFGLNALLVVATSVAACVLCEYGLQKYVLKITPKVSNLSAVVTGILLAFN